MKTSAFFASDIKAGQGDNTYQFGNRLIYKNSKFNPSGHYNSTTGEYSCPTSGIYLFAFSIFGYKIEAGKNSPRATASLMKEGVEHGKVFVNSYNAETLHITLSQSVVIQCNARDKVWVESRDNNNKIDGYSDFNVFTGVLLSII